MTKQFDWKNSVVPKFYCRIPKRVSIVFVEVNYLIKSFISTEDEYFLKKEGSYMYVKLSIIAGLIKKINYNNFNHSNRWDCCQPLRAINEKHKGVRAAKYYIQL